jgi:hypothetical protein
MMLIGAAIQATSRNSGMIITARLNCGLGLRMIVGLVDVTLFVLN